MQQKFCEFRLKIKILQTPIMKESPKPIDTPFSGFHQNSAYFSLFQFLMKNRKIVHALILIHRYTKFTLETLTLVLYKIKQPIIGGQYRNSQKKPFLSNDSYFWLRLIYF